MKGRPKGFGLFNTGNGDNAVRPSVNLMPTMDPEDSLNEWRGPPALERVLRERKMEFLRDAKGGRVEVGRGAFAKAYLAKDHSGNEFVIKEIDLSTLRDDQRKKAGLEVTFLKSLNHINVIRCLDAFNTTSYLHIVLEFASRGTLAGQIEEKKSVGGQFRREEVLRWAGQLFAALRHLHHARVLHRDLKTANVFLDAELRVKLGDFGLSRKLEDDENFSGQMVGTPYYFAPEVVQSRPFSNKTDMWSAGVVVYEVAFLQKPFQAKSIKGLYKKIQNGDYEKMPGDADPDVTRLLEAILKLEPGDRPSAAKLCSDESLASYVEGDLGATPPRKPLKPRLQSPRDGKKSKAVSNLLMSVAGLVPKSPEGAPTRSRKPVASVALPTLGEPVAVVPTPPKQPEAPPPQEEDEYDDDFEDLPSESYSDEDFEDYDEDFVSYETD